MILIRENCFLPFPHRAVRKNLFFNRSGSVCVCVRMHAAFMKGLILEGSVICRAAAVLFILA